MKRSIIKGFWFAVAILFLIESWLWTHMAALIARLVALVPLHEAKAWIIAKVQPLPPYATLAVFLIPVILLEPFKIVALWLFAKGHLVAGLLVFLAAKIVGLGVIAFLFEICKPKLLQIRWVNWLYIKAIEAKDWAKQQVAPTLHRIRVYRRFARIAWYHHLPKGQIIRSKILRRILWLRRKWTYTQ